MEYTHQDALLDFSNWYEKCIENGIEPEAVVADVGEMKLITNLE